MMISIAILALLAGPDGRTPVEARVASRHLIVPIAPPQGTSLSPAGLPGRCPASSPWSLADADQPQSEEDDEFRFLTVGSVRSSPLDEADWGRPRPLLVAGGVFDVGPAVDRLTPLRC